MSKRRISDSEMECEICGSLFFPYNPQSKYCSVKCKNEGLIQRNKQRSQPKHPNSVQKFEIFKRDGFRCHYCGRSPHLHGIVLVVDHILPHSANGETQKDNLISACEECNGQKSNLILSEDLLCFLKS